MEQTVLEHLPSFERQILSRLRLNATDAARVCGITPRQLQYWAGKGFVSVVDASEQCYDAESLGRAILIRRVMSEGHTLETANRMVASALAAEAEEQKRLESMSEGELREELSDYLEHLERRIASLRGELPTYLRLSRLGDAALPLDTMAMEQFFRENPHSFDTAQNLALRLGYAVDEVDRVLVELSQANVLIKGEGNEPVYRLRREP